MPDRDLKLNSLSRFSKQSPRLVLEEYGNCEVPAGCGGAVLRWRQADEPIPMTIRSSFGNGYWRNHRLDGVNTGWLSRIQVSYGNHAFTFENHEGNPEFAIVMLVGHLYEDYTRILQPQGDTTILSLPDGTWKYSLDQPSNDDWQRPEYDDSHWFSMVEKPLYINPKFGGVEYVNQWTQELAAQGAVALGLDTDNPVVAQKIQPLLRENQTLAIVYVRKTFSIHKRSEKE